MIDAQIRDGISLPDLPDKAVAPDVKLPNEPAEERDVDVPVGLAYVPGLSDRLNNLLEGIRRRATVSSSRRPM